MTSRTIELTAIDAQIKMLKSRRAKRLSINVNPDDGVKVTVPHRCSFRDAQNFISDHIDWINKNLEKIKKTDKKFLNDFNISNKKRAKAHLIRRLQSLAMEHGFKYNRVFIRSQKTRWGSCSEKNNINLNIKLAQIEPSLADYVILHELVHTRIKNHSPRFWKALDRLTANQARQLDKQLRKYWL